MLHYNKTDKSEGIDLLKVIKVINTRFVTIGFLIMDSIMYTINAII